MGLMTTTTATASIHDNHHEDLENFRAFLRSLMMHGAVGTALGGVSPWSEKQNLLIATVAGWDFLNFPAYGSGDHAGAGHGITDLPLLEMTEALATAPNCPTEFEPCWRIFGRGVRQPRPAVTPNWSFRRWWPLFWLSAWPCTWLPWA